MIVTPYARRTSPLLKVLQQHPFFFVSLSEPLATSSTFLSPPIGAWAESPPLSSAFCETIRKISEKID